MKTLPWFFLFLSLLVSSTSHAAIKSWTPTTNLLWSNPNNWSPSGVPVAGDAVYIGLTSLFVKCHINVNTPVLDSLILGANLDTLFQDPGVVITTKFLEMNSGVFQGGNSVIDIQGKYLQFGGTFISTSDTLKVGNRQYSSASSIVNESFFSKTASSAFVHNNGTVKLMPEYTTADFEDKAKNVCLDAGYSGNCSNLSGGSINFYNLVISAKRTLPGAVGLIGFNFNANVWIKNDFIAENGGMSKAFFKTSYDVRIKLDGDVYVHPGATGGKVDLEFTGINGNHTYYNIGSGGIAPGFYMKGINVNVVPAPGIDQFRLARIAMLKFGGHFTAPLELHIGSKTHDIGSLDPHYYNDEGGPGGFTAPPNSTVIFDAETNGETLLGVQFRFTEFQNVIWDLTPVGASNAYLKFTDRMVVKKDFTWKNGLYHGTNQHGVVVEGNVNFIEGGVQGTSPVSLFQKMFYLYFKGSNNQQYDFLAESSWAFDKNFMVVIVDKTGGVVSPFPNSSDFGLNFLDVRKGHFKLPQGEMRVGDLTYTNGTQYYSEYDGIECASTGQISNTGSGNVVMYRKDDMRIKGSEYVTFYNLEVDMTGSSPRSLLTTGNLTIDNDLLIHPNKSIDMDGDKSIITKNVINNGTINLTNKATLVQSSGGLISGTGTENYDQTGTQFASAYNLWSSPINSADFLTVFPNTNPCELYTYDASTQEFWYDWLANTSYTCNGVGGNTFNGMLFQDGTPDGAMDIARGYWVKGDPTNTYTFSGRANNGPLNITVVSTNLGNPSHGYWTGDDWNLVGNPYPSAIDLNTFVTANSTKISDAIYFWDHDDPSTNWNHISDYASWNLLGSTAASASTSSSVVPNGYVAGAQAFWVVGLDPAASYSLLFNNSMRIANNNNQFFKQDPDVDKMRIWLTVSADNVRSNEILIGTMPGASSGLDNFMDARKFISGAPLELSSAGPNQEKYVIQAFAPLAIREKKSIPLFITTTKSGFHTFKVERDDKFTAGYVTYLFDKKLNKKTPLSAGTTYTVALQAGKYDNRFYLVFENIITVDNGASTPVGPSDGNSNGTTTAVEDNIGNIPVEVVVFQSGDQLNINVTGTTLNEVILYNVVGAEVKRIPTSDSETLLIPVSSLQSGVYFVKYSLQNGTVDTRKVVIN